MSNRKVYYRKPDGSYTTMSSTYGRRPPDKKFTQGGMESIPAGAWLVPIELKEQYDTVPFHVYHPNPHNAVTILRNKKNQHEWLVCGWYVDTYRKDGVVKGLIYTQVSSEPDKETILQELKKHDKEASAKFGA
jgi:hypothetical protein